MDKVDFKKLMKPYWQPAAGVFSLIEVPKFRYVMIDGVGDPNASEDYQRAVQWLYGVSYALKFMSKADLARDYGVAPLEGLWWARDMKHFATLGKDQWHWTAMIMQPDWVGPDLFERAVAKTRGKLGAPPASLRLDDLEEGLSVQIMHVGPYDDEAATIARLHSEYLPANGLVETGHHHEIYLGDPRRTAPDKLRTVIRQPVRRA